MKDFKCTSNFFSFSEEHFKIARANWPNCKIDCYNSRRKVANKNTTDPAIFVQIRFNNKEDNAARISEDLSIYKNLKTLDLSNNALTSLPKGLLELELVGNLRPLKPTVFAKTNWF